MTRAATPAAVGFVPCLPPGAHPGMDALLQGMRCTLERLGFVLDVEPADLRARDPGETQGRAVRELSDRGVAGIVVFVLALTEPADAIAAAQRRGVPVVTVHETALPVAASLVVPNFAHGVALAGALHAAIAASGGAGGDSVGFVGPPEILDDLEFAHGVLFGLRQCRLRCVNDPFEPAYRNLDDVAGAGRDAVDRLLDDFPELDGLVVFNDETMRDALDALAARGVLGKLAAVCRNGSPEIVDAVRRGEVTATFDYFLPELGRGAAELVARAIGGETEPCERVAAPVGRLIARGNADRYVPWVDRLAAMRTAASGGLL